MELRKQSWRFWFHFLSFPQYLHALLGHDCGLPLGEPHLGQSSGAEGAAYVVVFINTLAKSSAIFKGQPV